MRPRHFPAIAVPAALTPAIVLAAGDGPPAPHPTCADFPTYEAALAWCIARYGTSVGCGGLDRDRDGMPCECNPGHAAADRRTCTPDDRAPPERPGS